MRELEVARGPTWKRLTRRSASTSDSNIAVRYDNGSDTAGSRQADSDSGRKAEEIDTTTAEWVLHLSVVGQTCCGVCFEIAFADRVEDAYTVTEIDDVRLIVDPDSREYAPARPWISSKTPEGSGFKVDARRTQRHLRLRQSLTAIPLAPQGYPSGEGVWR